MRNHTVESLDRRGAEVVLLEDQLNLFSDLSVETILEGAQCIFVTPLGSHIRCDPGRTRDRGMYVDRRVSCPASRPNTRATAIESLPAAQEMGEWRRSPLPARPGSCVRTHVPSFDYSLDRERTSFSSSVSHVRLPQRSSSSSGVSSPHFVITVSPTILTNFAASSGVSANA